MSKYFYAQFLRFCGGKARIEHHDGFTMRSGLRLEAPAAAHPLPKVLKPICLSATVSPASHLRVAVVHEWLSTYAGSEQVLAETLSLYPEADLYAVVDFLPPNQRAFLTGRKVNVSFIQHLPLARKRFRWYLPLMPLAIEQINLSAYDLIISNSHAVSKGVLTRAHQLHVSYVYTPIRYAWDLQEEYLNRSGGMGMLKSAMGRLLMHYLRMWDLRTSSGVDLFVAASEFIARRIMRTYRRPATVVYPPVNVDNFPLREKKEEFYATVARLVPYKRVDLLLEAFAGMPQRKLIVIGTGPELSKLRRRASANVDLRGSLPDADLRNYVARAKAFVYAAEEDFGISMVEAQACGTPVIAFARGGAAEIVVDGQTGLLFNQQTPDAIISAISEFERDWHFDPALVRRNAMRFGVSRFRDEFTALVNDAIREHQISGGGFLPHTRDRERGARARISEAPIPPSDSLDVGVGATAIHRQ
jgi:glycosyltransferase involved in cell wall biosynthesis